MQDQSDNRKTGSGDPNEAPEPVSELPGGLNRRKILHLVVVDTLVLAELALAIVLANHWKEQADFQLVFCGVFFGLVIPTIFVSRRIARRYVPPAQEAPGP